MTWNRSLKEIIAEDYSNQCSLYYEKQGKVVVTYEGLIERIIKENLIVFVEDKIGASRFFFIKKRRQEYKD